MKKQVYHYNNNTHIVLFNSTVLISIDGYEFWHSLGEFNDKTIKEDYDILKHYNLITWDYDKLEEVQ